MDTRTRFQGLELSLGKDHINVTAAVGSNKRTCISGKIGCKLSAASKVSSIDTKDDSVTYTWPDQLTLRITFKRYEHGDRYDVTWNRPTPGGVLTEEYDLLDAHWYGGAQLHTMRWPLERCPGRAVQPFISGDSFKDEYGGVLEPLFMSSRGAAIWVNPEVHLHVGFNHKENHKLILTAKTERPYRNPTNAPLCLKYSLFVTENVKEAFLLATQCCIPRPSDIPDEELFRKPIWSTWAKYKRDISEQIVLDFAADINKHGFKSCQVEIDDDWTPAYGDMTFDEKKFPDPARVVAKLKEMGHRATLWVHPFCSIFSKAASIKEYWLDSFPTGHIVWWNGVGKYLDVTNPAACKWFVSNLQELLAKYGFHSYKFDAGEINWCPGKPKMHEEWSHPHVYCTKYAKMALEIEPLHRSQEIRVGTHTQDIPLFVRMMDKLSVWGFENGLRSLIPHALTFGLIGYPFVLPDMIGGNAYKGVPDRELFIRWLQANVFMPSMQFSLVPWQYDEEVIEIAREMTRLHEHYGDWFVQLAKESTRNGTPIMRPLWWIDPTDEQALTIDDEFLVGDDVIVAPILEQGARSRSVYLPIGQWRDELRHELFTGPTWVMEHKVDLKELAYFTRQPAEDEQAPMSVEPEFEPEFDDFE